MKKIGIAILCMVLAVAMLLVGCGGQESQNSSSSADNSNSSSTDVSDESQAENGEDNVLVMSTNALFPPYEYYDGDQIVGIDPEIAQAIAEKLGMTLQINDMEFESAIAAAQTGQSDIVMAGVTITPDREENLNFTETYATGIQVVIVKEDSDITSIDDLEGKLIGVQQGTTGDIYCSGDYGEEAVVKYSSGPLAVEALKNGQVDCVVIDNEPAKEFVAANDGLKILDTEFTNEDYAIGIAKDNTELFEKVNNALKELMEDGTVQSIIDKYINADE